MALRFGGRKQRGEKGGSARGGCCHFHVLYHLPRRVCTFSFLRWLPRFSLLSCVLTPLVLFFAVLAFLGSFVWFTLLYFVASLLNKDRSHEFFKNDSFGRASDADKHRREGSGKEGKAEAVKHVAEPLTGDSAAAQVCVKRLEIKEVHVDGFSKVSQNISRMASSVTCLDCEVRTNDDKLVEDVIIFETSREEMNANADLEGFSIRHQVQDVTIDWFVEEFVNDMKELSASSYEICDFIHKYETREQVLDGFANDEKIGVLTSSDGSAHGGIRDEHKKESSEEKDARSLLELLVDSVATLEGYDEQQEIQKVHELSIIEANTKQSVGASDEVHDFTNDNETLVLSLYSVCEDTASSDAWSNHYIGYEDDKHEELMEKNIVETFDQASVVCDFVENHQTTTEALDDFANEDNTGEVVSMESSEDKADKSNDNCTSKLNLKGASRSLPLVRRSPAPWWSLCGVVDVFAGCKD